MLNRFTDLKHDWERQHLENSRDIVFKNTYKDIEYILTSCAPTAPASSSSATTSGTSTTWRTS